MAEPPRISFGLLAAALEGLTLAVVPDRPVYVTGGERPAEVRGEVHSPGDAAAALWDTLADAEDQEDPQLRAAQALEGLRLADKPGRSDAERAECYAVSQVYALLAVSAGLREVAEALRAREAPGA